MADFTITIVVAEADAARTIAALSAAGGAATPSPAAARAYMNRVLRSTVRSVESAADRRALEDALPVRADPTLL